MPLVPRLAAKIIDLCEKNEICRATKVLDKLASEFFLSDEDLIPADVMAYASTSPSLVKALMAYPYSLKKICSKNKMSLTEILLNKAGMYTGIDLKILDSLKRSTKNPRENSAIIEKSEVVLKGLIEEGTFQKDRENNHLLPFFIKSRIYAFRDKKRSCSPM